MTHDQALAAVKAAEDHLAPLLRAARVQPGREASLDEALDNAQLWTPGVVEPLDAALAHLELLRVELEDMDGQGGALEPGTRRVG